MDQEAQQSLEAKIAKALKDAEVAKRRATMALGCAKEALRLTLSTPRIGKMLQKIEKELQDGDA
jgi:hypothetical protein